MDGPWTLIGKTAEINEWVNWHSCEKLSIVYSGPIVELIESCQTPRVGPQSRHSINRPITSVKPTWAHQVTVGIYHEWAHCVTSRNRSIHFSLFYPMLNLFSATHGDSQA